MERLALESTDFGWLVANGTRYDHDLVITADARLLPRPKHLSKKYGGWHTVLGPEEIADAIADAPEILLIGCGRFNLLPICDPCTARKGRCETRARRIARCPNRNRVHARRACPVRTVGGGRQPRRGNLAYYLLKEKMNQEYPMLRKIFFFTISSASIILTACNAVATPLAPTATISRAPRAAPTSTRVAFTATPAPSSTPLSTLAPLSTRAATLATPLAIGKLPMPIGIPVSSWHDFPIMPGVIAGQDNDKGGYLYSVRATPQQIQDFYTGEMKKLGWDLLTADTKANDPGYRFLIYNQANYPTLSVLMSVQGDTTIVFLAN